MVQKKKKKKSKILFFFHMEIGIRDLAGSLREKKERVYGSLSMSEAGPLKKKKNERRKWNFGITKVELASNYDE